jgi:hypothetical protein|nr:MAG TPA: hypothetical protein [Bacteriophage sp.]
MANFGSKNETFAYLVGKDIAEIKAKIESIGTTSGGLDVLKVIVPAVTEEQVNDESLCVATLPKEFQSALLVLEQNGSWNFIISENEMGFQKQTTETEYFLVKLTDFKNPKETARATIEKSSGYQASDA